MMRSTHPVPWRLVIELVRDVVLRRRRSFRQDALYCVANRYPPLQVYGEQYIPSQGPCLITFNHYFRPGFKAWWLALGIGSLIPVEMFWILAGAWTYPDFLRRNLLTPASQVLFRRLAGVYGFTTMPPIPPRPQDVEARASAVRRVLAYARHMDKPVIGLAPEGMDSPVGELGKPPPGAGRFIQQLTRIGLMLVPVGAFEEGDVVCLRFGPSYRLEVADDLSPQKRDQYASALVMDRIRELID